MSDIFLVTGRLERPDNLIRKMASNIALAFSKVVDPKNPLYLDDSCHEENIDREFGLATSDKTSGSASHNKDEDSNNLKSSPDVALEKEVDSIGGAGMSCNARETKKKPSEFKLVDPDEVVDPVTLNSGFHSDGEEDDVASEDSEASSDSSLQPYDLTDDDTDLKRKFSHLIDVVGALRKSDDADGVSYFLFNYIKINKHTISCLYLNTTLILKEMCNAKKIWIFSMQVMKEDG